MRLRYAILCDSSNETNDGKLNLFGITEAIYAYQFPAVHREIHLICAFEIEPSDAEVPQIVEVQLIDMDGKQHLGFKSEVVCPPGRTTLNHRHLLHDLQFPAAGSYEFVVFVQGKRVGSASLGAFEVPRPA